MNVWLHGFLVLAIVSAVHKHFIVIKGIMGKKPPWKHLELIHAFACSCLWVHVKMLTRQSQIHCTNRQQAMIGRRNSRVSVMLYDLLPTSIALRCRLDHSRQLISYSDHIKGIQLQFANRGAASYQVEVGCILCLLSFIEPPL